MSEKVIWQIEQQKKAESKGNPANDIKTKMRQRGRACHSEKTLYF